MIKNSVLKWVVICGTGAIVYACNYGSGLHADWAQVFGGASVLAVLLCGKLTGFPAKEA